MSDDAFDRIEQALRSGGAEAGFDFLVQKSLEDKNYPLLFEARLLQKRHELGLPLIQTDPSADLPAEKRRPYEETFLQAAREVGGLFLADGNIARAWPYFRAIGETAPVAAAIDKAEPKDDLESIVAIAFQERVHPKKGFELILANYGICRAITCFGQYPDRNGRDDCLRLLVRTLYHEIAENLKRVIAQQEGQAPEAAGIPALIEGRDWLFEGNCYYVDTSHLVSILGLSLDLDDPEMLRLAVDLTEYGKRLGSLFQYKGDPPFEDIYADHGVYLRALVGEDVDGAIAHFRRKVAESDPSQVGSGPAQVLVGLLARLERYEEAIEVSLEQLRDLDSSQLACPSVLQLCQLAGNYDRLRQIARQQGDIVSFAAGALQTEPGRPVVP